MALKRYMIHVLACLCILCGFFIRTSQQQCTFDWVEMEGRHALGFEEFGTRGSITEDECKSACEDQESCRALDYNNLDRSCFLGEESNAETGENSAIDHWELTRNCDSNQTSGQATTLSSSSGSSNQTDSVTGSMGSESSTSRSRRPTPVANSTSPSIEVSNGGSEPTEPTSGCTFDWVETAGRHALGFEEFGTRGVITEDECKGACEEQESCKALDYNNLDRSCFLGEESNAPTGNNSVIDHWELTRNCPSNESSESTTPTAASNESSESTTPTAGGGDGNVTSPTGGTAVPPSSTDNECQTSFTQYKDRVALNGVLIESIKSALDCITSCENTSPCTGLEIKHLPGENIECYLHFSSADFQNFYRSPNNTQIILKRCPEKDITICNSSFTETTGKFSTGGTLNADAKTLEDCMQACQDAGPVCRGFDFYSDNRCMLHTEDTLGLNLRTQSGVSQYRLEDTCSAVCIPKWETYQDMKGSGSKPVDVNLPSGNLSACIEYCARTRPCIGIVYESVGESSSSTCSYYESDQLDAMQQRTPQAMAVQYELVDRCAIGCGTAYEVMENQKVVLRDAKIIDDAENADDCESYCDYDASCEAFYYTKSDPFVCTTAKSWVYGSAVPDSNYNSVIFAYTDCTNLPPTLPPTPGSNGSEVTTVSSSNSPSGPDSNTTSGPGSNTTSGPGSNTTSGPGSNTTSGPGSNTTSGSGSNTTTAGSGSNTTEGSGEPSVTSSSATTENTTGSCSKQWSLIEGRHMLGLDEHGSDGDYTEEECKKECEALPNCKVADYNVLDEGCYLGEESAEESELRNNSNINHWEVTEICSSAGETSSAEPTTAAPEEGSSVSGSESSNSSESQDTSPSSNTTATPGDTTGSCSNEWSVVEGRHMLGLEEHGNDGDYTEEECKKECENLPSCKVADYNTLDEGCYLGEEYPLASELRQNENINHWELLTVCSSGGGSNTTGSGEGSTISSEGQNSSSSNTTASEGAPAATTAAANGTAGGATTAAGAATTARSGNATSAKAGATTAGSGGATSAAGAATTAGPPTTTTASSNTSGCEPKWELVPRRNSPGLEQVGEAREYDEEKCKSLCELITSCSVVDYNSQDGTCFHGNNRNHFTVNNTAVQHWILRERCQDQCSTTISAFLEMHAQGLSRFGAAGNYTEAGCKEACLMDKNCNNLDYNWKDRSCFHGKETNPFIVPMSGINHYNIKRVCPGD